MVLGNILMFDKRETPGNPSDPDLQQSAAPELVDDREAPGTTASTEAFVQALPAIAHELSEALTAASAYLKGGRHLFEHGGRLDSMRRAVEQAHVQVGRANDAVRRLRERLANQGDPDCDRSREDILSKPDDVDRLLGAWVDPGIAARHSDDASYRLERWSPDASRLLSLVAAVCNQAVALAAHDAAIREYPGERLVLCVGDRILADSETGSAEPAAEPAPELKLSAREAQVIALLVRGFSMKEVARALGIAPRTVAFHKYKAMDANGIRNNAELMDLALRQGLLDPATPAETERLRSVSHFR